MSIGVTPTTDESKKEEALSTFARPVRNTAQAMNDDRRHADARSIREAFGMPPYRRERFDWPSVLPDCMEHKWDPPAGESDGGTDFLCRGKPGAGKSTLANSFAARMMEINNEKVVWRGSSSRSEWLPLAPWTRLLLPSNTPVSIRLVPKRPTDDTIALDLDDLERIVREVVYYDSPTDVNHNILQQGAFHVIYPDPQMRGCQEVYEAAEEKQYGAPSGRTLFDASDPAQHWWFAWFLARVEQGPHHWTTWVCDEIGDLCPQSAMKDEFGTYQKVELLKDSWVDARKFGLTVHAYCHNEGDLHSMVREKLRWRIQMPNTANPRSAANVVGFETIPMDADMTSRMNVGRALMYTETNFEKFAFTHMKSPSPYKLKIKLGGA